MQSTTSCSSSFATTTFTKLLKLQVLSPLVVTGVEMKASQFDVYAVALEIMKYYTGRLHAAAGHTSGLSTGVCFPPMPGNICLPTEETQESCQASYL